MESLPRAKLNKRSVKESGSAQGTGMHGVVYEASRYLAVIVELRNKDEMDARNTIVCSK